MQISRLTISNILGIKHLEIEPGAFNEIAGPNGTGKTSVLEAIKAVLEGGHDATLLRKGEEAGEIVLVLDDDTRLRKRVTPKGSTLEAVQDGKKVSKPADIVKALTDLLSVNPVDFLRAPKKDRVRVLLETMPIVADPDRLEEISGIPVHVEEGQHGLAVIEMVRKQVYDDRTGTNRAIKEKDNTINQLKLAMPEAPAGVTGSEDELRAELEAANAAKDAELERVRTKLDGIRKENFAEITRLKAEAQAQIDEINRQLDEAVMAIEDKEREVEGKAATQRELTIKKHADTVAPINQALEIIKNNRENAARREQAVETIKQMEVELGELEADARRQTQALNDIEAYKEELLAGLPIPGLEVRDGDVYRNGVQFDRLNTAQQVGIAVEIAKLRAGELGVCCVDGIELLDTAAFEEFRDRALESGLQLFVSRVADHEFQINIID